MAIKKDIIHTTGMYETVGSNTSTIDDPSAHVIETFVFQL